MQFQLQDGNYDAKFLVSICHLSALSSIHLSIASMKAPISNIKSIEKQFETYKNNGKLSYKAGLKNISSFCKIFDLLDYKMNCIHIAGTNGKGSIASFVSTIFIKSGYKIGLFTSPHFLDFRERIQINGQIIDEKFIVNFYNIHNKYIHENGISFFEFTAALAFAYFSAEKVDWMIIECGLGGRDDATNIVIPKLSIISNISHDHIDILGPSLKEVAKHKAGIIKSKRPVLVGNLGELLPIIEEEAKIHSSIVYKSEHLVHINRHKHTHNQLNIRYTKTKYFDIKVPLPYFSDYQIENLQTSLAAIEIIAPEIKLSDRFLEDSIEESFVKGMKGRMHWLANTPKILLDGAHNIAAFKQLRNSLGAIDYSALHILLGCAKDKELNKIFSILPRDAKYYFTTFASPRATPIAQLAAYGDAQGLDYQVYTKLENAYKEAKKNLEADDLLVVCGSLYLLGDLYQYLAMEKHKEFMRKAISLAEESVKNGGGPFGAVIVKDDKIVAEGNNLVTSSNDPTAHAEVVAIRRACEALESYQLEDCVLYTSCEPCPMCLGAIYWARPKAIYYANDRNDAAHIGFDDELIYQEINKKPESRVIPMYQLLADEAIKAFQMWGDKDDKVEY